MNEQSKKKWLDFDTIKAETDVEQLLQHYNLLEQLEIQSGAYVGFCPLGTKKHGKKDSFNFNLKKKTFKCFACKQHGSVLDFVAKYQGVHLRESAEIILEIMAGVGEKTNNPRVDLVALEKNSEEFFDDEADDDLSESGKNEDTLSNNENKDDVNDYLREMFYGKKEGTLLQVPKPIPLRTALLAIKEKRRDENSIVIFDVEELSIPIALIQDNFTYIQDFISFFQQHIEEGSQPSCTSDSKPTAE